jgi:hypothetical protein
MVQHAALQSYRMLRALFRTAIAADAEIILYYGNLVIFTSDRSRSAYFHALGTPFCATGTDYHRFHEYLMKKQSPILEGFLSGILT